MSLNLDIYPISYPELTLWLGSCVLPLLKDPKLFNVLKNSLYTIDLPESKIFEIFDESGLEKKKKDFWGDKLTYTLPKEFDEIFSNYFNEKNYTFVWNKAVLNMLRCLPEETPLVLYWY